MTSGLRVAAMLPVAEFREEDYVLMLTRKGMLKKMAMSHFAKIPARGSTAIGLNVRCASCANHRPCGSCPCLLRLHPSWLCQKVRCLKQPGLPMCGCTCCQMPFLHPLIAHSSLW